MKIINMTSHTIVFSNWKKIKSSWNARLEVETKEIGKMDWVKIFKTVFWQCNNMPQCIPWVAYIVSKLICEKYKDRGDLYVPTNSKRDGNGRIIFVWWLSRNPYFIS